MKLETEFRVRLQLLQLEQTFRNASTVHPQDYLPQSASAWVQLVQPPSDLCGDEALLLCQDGDDEWLAWIPNYGEIVLSLDEFYELP